MWVGVRYASCSLQTGAATDAGSAHCRGYLLSNVLRVLALSLPGGSQGFQDVVSTGMISISSSTRPSVNGGRVVRPLPARSPRMSALTVPVRRVWPSVPGIADRQSPRLLPQHCDIGQAVAAQRRRRRVRHDLPRIVDRPRRPACRRPEPRSRPARDSRSGARVSIGPRTADAHRGSAAGTNTCSGAAVPDDDRGASMPARGGAALLPREPAGAQRQGIATLATTCC